MAVAFGRTGLRVTEQGIEIRNPLSRTKITWDRIRGFRIGRHSFMRAVCIIDLVDGSSKHAFAIQVPNRSLNRQDTRERRMVEELNERLRDHQTERRPEPGS
jgi:hypothetical protein